WYVHMRFWWVHLMILIWLVFTILAFIGEPLIHQRIVKMIEDNPVLAWHRLRTAHILIWLTLLTTVLCAVGGAQGAF
ncbi:MAG: hypothetical protein KGL58_03455, partial [Pseudomonadota bacterium]|nr:hypothetical protein [Pseudomonadota bacterium]